MNFNSLVKMYIYFFGLKFWWKDCWIIKFFIKFVICRLLDSPFQRPLRQVLRACVVDGVGRGAHWSAPSGASGPREPPVASATENVNHISNNARSTITLCCMVTSLRTPTRNTQPSPRFHGAAALYCTYRKTRWTVSSPLKELSTSTLSSG